MATDDGGSQGPDAPRDRLTIIVDGANVVGSRPDGWWHDRAGAAVRLYDDLLRLAVRGIPVSDDVRGTGGAGGPTRATAPCDARQAVEVVLVLEGAARAAVPRLAARTRAAAGGRVRVVSAPGSGDDEIVRLARSLPGRRVVVTADRELRRRCEAAGAEVASPSWLYGQL
jgi:hypothetical protein